MFGGICPHEVTVTWTVDGGSVIGARLQLERRGPTANVAGDVEIMLGAAHGGGVRGEYGAVRTHCIDHVGGGTQLVSTPAAPNLVTVYSFGRHRGAPYLVMKLIDGMGAHRAGHAEESELRRRETVPDGPPSVERVLPTHPGVVLARF